MLISDCRNVLLEGFCLWVLGVIECGVHLSMSAVDATKDGQVVLKGFSASSVLEPRHVLRLCVL